MRHHPLVAVAVAVEEADQRIHRWQPRLREHRIGTVAPADVFQPPLHRVLVGAGCQHRQRQNYRYDCYYPFHVFGNRFLICSLCRLQLKFPFICKITKKLLNYEIFQELIRNFIILHDFV